MYELILKKLIKECVLTERAYTFGLISDNDYLRAKIGKHKPIVGLLNFGHKTLFIAKPKTFIHSPKDEERWESIKTSLYHYADYALSFDVREVEDVRNLYDGA